MAGISPTSCVPLPLRPFMWLQEEKALTEKKSFVAGAVMQCLSFLNRVYTDTEFSRESSELGGRFCCNGTSLRSF